MRKLLLAAVLAACTLPALARAEAQFDMRINIGLPVAPPLVVVQPGVQVVENYQEEVFFTRGWYWVRRDGGRWYRARSPRATFVYVEPRYVPAAIVRVPPGHYKHWNHEQAKAERKAWKREAKAERREERREYREHERHENKGHGNGRGHGHGHDD